MRTTTVEIPTPDGTADAFVAFPDDGARHPGVLLYVDAIGLRPVIHEMARKLAAEGYYVLAPNIFYRHGPAPVLDVPDLSSAEAREAFFARLMPLLDELTVERSARDADAYLDFLTARPEVRPGPAGVVGYCMGAVLAVRAAAESPDRVAAAACFHPGPLVTGTPDSPHLLAPQLNAELLFGLAEHDDSMPPEAVAELHKALGDVGVRYVSEVYPGTVHGFTMADTAAFSPSGLQRHWERLLPFFARTLATG
ncbi:dienelactone hydrolase family protein [Streptomyces sp. UNOC14_S4]|uniref:dienelactone hydrolase family protein n=1 Tax=Streptomyces sp. UNOC14_S4 TaxID=2872340 RepID=UPI001E39FE83|nr:dienelactone hydrolase family protein [Streptomyces sp. UNOC14_S4]MCC3772612.1 dienelactone hydrolase family protein [Streptomyces sp. UNOC14_S4]